MSDVSDATPQTNDVSETKPQANGDNAEREIVTPLATPGGRYVRVRHIKQPDQAATIDQIRNRLNAVDIDTKELSIGKRINRFLIGSPIPTEMAIHERIGKFKALAILSSDALSSVAYGTEASLAVLATAGISSLVYNIPLGLLVVVLLGIVAFSYRQTIFHYPNGGGSYIVARENLNVHFGLIAAGALLIDYVLTVSVSVSSGVDNLISAFPAIPASIHLYSLFIPGTHFGIGGWTISFKIILGLFLILLIVVVNLRGVRESGTIFAAPTYLFVGSFMLMLVVGVIHAMTTGGAFNPLPPIQPHHPLPVADHLTAFLILTAFASGCSAMTGVEAISNGVPIFKPRQEKNAAETLTLMAILLGIMFTGTTYLAWRFGLVPNADQNPTIISQLASLFFSGWFGWFYYVFLIATVLILVLAANTSFADFPRLSSILARDEFLPHIFGMQGDRLAFNTGIISLGVFASILLTIFEGNTDALINLYALGVFLAFTMSQSGMVRRWLRTREPGWRQGLAINATGAAVTGVVTVIIAISKFDRGAWVVVILIPMLYFMFRGVHRHYANVAQSVVDMPVRRPGEIRHIMVVPIASFNNLALRGLSYARSLTPFVLAVHVAMDEENAAKVARDWNDLVKNKKFMRGGPIMEDSVDEIEGLPPRKDDITGPELIIIDSPFRTLNRPIINYIDKLRRDHPNDLITVVLPEFVVNHFWEAALHNQTALWLKWALLGRSQIVTTNVPYHFDRQAMAKTRARDEEIEEAIKPQADVSPPVSLPS